MKNKIFIEKWFSKYSIAYYSIRNENTFEYACVVIVRCVF